MKDGTTRMGYKAEHAVDLGTDIVVAVNVQPGNAPDTATIIDTAIDAAVNAEQAGVETDVKAIVADKGYHSSNWPWKKSSETFSRHENLRFSRAFHARHVIHDVPAGCLSTAC
jgi:hypothetical protein